MGKRRCRLEEFAVVVVVVVVAGGVTAVGAEAPCDFLGTSLRQQAKGLGLDIGVATRLGYIENDKTHANLIGAEFNMLVTDDALKMTSYYTPGAQPGTGTFDFTNADALIKYATDHNMVVRGHTLFYHAAIPGGVRQWDMPRDAWRAWAAEVMCTVMGRYKGVIRDYDVVNEAVTVESVDGPAAAYGDGFRKTFLSHVLGGDYVAFLFRQARECDPTARLYLNDYLIEYVNAKSDRLFEIVRDYRADGVPIDGVGIQAHIASFAIGNEALYTKNFERFANEGILMSFTELDVMVLCQDDPMHFEVQADLYFKFVTWALEFRPHFTAVAVWGLLDPYSWVKNNPIFPCKGKPLLFEGSGKKKKAYFAFQQALCNASEAPPQTSPSPPPPVVDTSKQRKLKNGVRYFGKDFNVKQIGGRYGKVGWNLWSTGYMETTFDLDNMRRIVILCIPQLAGATPPKLVAAVDSVEIGSRFVKERRRVKFVLPEGLSGLHTLRVTFTNDYFDKATGQDRNLVVVHASWLR